MRVDDEEGLIIEVKRLKNVCDVECGVGDEGKEEKEEDGEL